MSKTKEQKPEYNNYLQEKIDKVRKVVKQGEEKSNEQVEDKFAQRRSVSPGEADKQ